MSAALPSVVIIPTTGAPELARAVHSVLTQTVPSSCYVVCDGARHESAVRGQIGHLLGHADLRLCVLPQNTGAGGFNGHRIYASFPHLVAEDFVLFLDQDNWFDPQHVQSCTELIAARDLQWCYSLRQVCDKDGTAVCTDDCESLGLWPGFDGDHLIDTNCFCIRREHLVRVCQAWHGPSWQDRIFTQLMLKRFPAHACTGRYTVNYRLGGNPKSVTRAFFEQGNALMRAKFGEHLPWRAVPRS